MDKLTRIDCNEQDEANSSSSSMVWSKNPYVKNTAAVTNIMQQQQQFFLFLGLKFCNCSQFQYITARAALFCDKL
jgi:hypothetical protein